MTLLKHLQTCETIGEVMTFPCQEYRYTTVNDVCLWLNRGCNIITLPSFQNCTNLQSCNKFLNILAKCYDYYVKANCFFKALHIFCQWVSLYQYFLELHKSFIIRSTKKWSKPFIYREISFGQANLNKLFYLSWHYF